MSSKEKGKSEEMMSTYPPQTENMFAREHVRPVVKLRVPESPGKGRKPGVSPQMWSEEEDQRLRQAIADYGERNWKLVAQSVPGRNYIQCLQRWKKSLRPGLRKGHWTDEEDKKLLKLVKKHAPNWDWATMAKLVPGRSAKQCRERWFLNLDPNINHGPWSAEEDHQLLEFVRLNGGKWSLIAKYMPGRTENSVKTRYYSLQRKEARNQKWNETEDSTILDTVLTYGRDFDRLDKQLKHRTKGQIKKRFNFLSQNQPEVMEAVLALEKRNRRKRKAERDMTSNIPKAQTQTLSPNSIATPDTSNFQTIKNESYFNTSIPQPKTKLARHGSTAEYADPKTWLKGIAQSIQESTNTGSKKLVKKTLSTCILQEILKPQEANANANANANASVEIPQVGGGIESSDLTKFNANLNMNMNMNMNMNVNQSSNANANANSNNFNLNMNMNLQEPLQFNNNAPMNSNTADYQLRRVSSLEMLQNLLTDQNQN